jgi:hypothetical protein
VRATEEAVVGSPDAPSVDMRVRREETDDEEERVFRGAIIGRFAVGMGSASRPS